MADLTEKMKHAAAASLLAVSLGTTAAGKNPTPQHVDDPISPAASAASKQSVQDAEREKRHLKRICDRATTYRSDCHGAPPHEPDGGILNQKASAAKPAASHPKPDKATRDALKQFTAAHDRAIIKKNPHSDIDGCSIIPQAKRVKDPGLCGAVERNAIRDALTLDKK